MAKESAIQWTQNTWNPWHGCKKVSDGCKYCYMYRDKQKYGQDPTVVIRSKTKFKDPLKWEDPALVFTCSWSDFFIEEADQWRDEAWDIIRKTPHLTYQILTKRPERIEEHLPADWGAGYENVWIGISVENQKEFDNRMPTFIKVPATVRFLSIEPLLGELSFRWAKHIGIDGKNGTWHLDSLHDIQWVIIGGESGNDNGLYRYRKCNLEWIEKLTEECKEAQVPVFVKQLGTHLSKQLGMSERHGGNINEFPEHLRIRQFPKNIIL